MTLKSGWCLTRYCGDCPVWLFDRESGGGKRCECTCHAKAPSDDAESLTDMSE